VRRRSANPFPTIQTEGGLLPVDLLVRLVEGDARVGGLDPASFHLDERDRLNEEASRVWTRLLRSWADFATATEAVPESEPGTTVTRERWLLKLFAELGYGRLPVSRLAERDERAQGLSHYWQQTPIHLVGFRIDLDHRTPGAVGAARMTPHGLVQGLLNARDDLLWGFVSNGLRLRILRDSARLTRLAYLEFDLEQMMTGEVFSDFVVLWLLCHQSRVEPEEPGRPETCWLERWAHAAEQQGTRALDDLRQGVKEAIAALGRGFLKHAANGALREKLRAGKIDVQDYYRELLRLVYRLIFLLVAEERELLFEPSASADARERYLQFYATARLRQLAARRRGSRHGDLWQAMRLVMRKLGSDAGCPELALPVLGSFLWSSVALPDLETSQLANADLLDAIRAIGFDRRGETLRPVDFRNLGSEELGSVYESLLELHPVIDPGTGDFDLQTLPGHERKTTGSYYTPAVLIDCLLDSALDPVLDHAAKQRDPAGAMLALKVCDPACGSGHFLIAGAHRMARRLAQVRTGDEEPSPRAVRTALRDVIGRCIYGVDRNPMAVELCKVSLWLEALEPGKPLSFLEHRIRGGNSLLGATPKLLAGGIPDAAFEVIEGDEKKVVSALKKQNRREREGQTSLFAQLAADAVPVWRTLGAGVMSLDAVDDGSIEGLQEKERHWHRLAESREYTHERLVADAWSASFVWRKAQGAPEAMTQDVFRRLRQSPDEAPASVRAEVERLRDRYGFFHWHLEFPDVFRVPAQGEATDNPDTGWNGGFDVVLGNPPWERIKLQEKEWFAARRPDIANAPNAAARRKLISRLTGDDPELLAAFLEDRREAEGESHLVRDSERYPLCGRGDVNTYAVFAEVKRSLISPRGRVGTIVPSGIATDDTTKHFFQSLIDGRQLGSLYDFENAVGLFPGVGHGRQKFCLLTMAGAGLKSNAAEFAFFLHWPEELRAEGRKFNLSAEDIALLNPNTHTCPIFRSAHDAELTKAIYRRVAVLVREGPPEENPWGVAFLRMFDMATDSGLFRIREQLEAAGWQLDGNVFRKESERYLPLYEAKMVHHCDHRFGDWADYPEGALTSALPDVPVERLQDPNYVVRPRYWVPEAEVNDRLEGKWARGWLLGWRDICRATDVRTVIASAIPIAGVGDKFLLMRPAASPGEVACLLANLMSFAFDYIARQKLGGTSLKYFTMKQLPALSPTVFAAAAPWDSSDSVQEWVLRRVLELVFTAWDLAPFARDCGWEGSPFRWDANRRLALRCELDAAFFHLYGLDRDEVDYVMETFHIVRDHDKDRFGDYRTKLMILRYWDALRKAVETEHAYETTLDPPPADVRMAHTPIVHRRADPSGAR
jgi:hypothetical protein